MFRRSKKTIGMIPWLRSRGKEEGERPLHGVERAAIGVLGTMHPLAGMGLSAQCTSRKGAGEDRTLWASHAFSKSDDQEGCGSVTRSCGADIGR
jgi:hypothetical protein